MVDSLIIDNRVLTMAMQRVKIIAHWDREMFQALSVGSVCDLAARYSREYLWW